MEEVFIPDLASGYRWLSFAVVVAVGAGAWTVYAYRGGIGNGRKVGQTVGPLLALVGTVGAAAVFLDMTRSPIVAIAPDYIILGNDTVPAAAVRRIYLEPIAVGGGYGASAVQEELAVIEFADGGTLLFSQGEYDTRALVEAADEIMGK